MLRFDTSDRKPRLWNIAVATVVFAAVMAFATIGGTTDPVVFPLIVDAYLAAVIIMLAAAWIGQIHYNPYSYNTIYYIGFAVFALSVLLTNLYLTADIVRSPDVYSAERCFQVLFDSAKNFMMISLPLIIVCSVVLVVSNVELIRFEGRSIANVLGILLAFALIAGEAFLFWGAAIDDGVVMKIVTGLFAAIYLYFECMLIGTVVANAVVVRHEPDPDKDFVIILGCGLRKDGTLTPLLKGRCDRALKFASKQKDMTGKEIKFVTSGGQGEDEIISESEAMRRYLIDNGIPDNMIIKEDHSTSTLENMRFSRDKIIEADPEGKVIYSTTNYHVFRSGTYARLVKMRATGIGAPTKWYFWPNAAVREFTSLLTEHRGKQVLIFTGMIVFYTGLIILALR
ncbi:MAG: YdcF family protein [Clostridiales bacterium]|nr:YdcF family protein [Clostridiales bacterium]